MAAQGEILSPCTYSLSWPDCGVNIMGRGNYNRYADYES